MVELTVDNFFEDEEDDFFAEAFRSVSEIESSSVKSNISLISQKNSAAKDENIPASIPVSDLNELNQSIKENSCSEISFKHQNKKDLLKSDNKKNDNFQINLRSEHVIHDIMNSTSRKSDSESNNINCRFNPGFTPKSKKRKFAGPAGVFVEDDNLIETHYLKSVSCESSKKPLSTEDNEFSNISSSQILAEELSQTLSWKKLQEDVSSNHYLLSTAKLYSIQRVLNDTAKKKLPKHTVVPVLCVYLKKFCCKEPVSVYMDDTGEINGKIDKEVIELYGDNIRSGIAFVLKKITFVCNVMILEKSNLVSIYLNDGTVKHLQSWDSAIETETRSNALDCVCPAAPESKIKSVVSEQLRNSSSSRQRPNKSKSLKKTLPLSRSSNKHFVKGNIFHSKTTEHRDLTNHNKIPTDLPAVIEKDMEDVNMDEFDILLGSLDEKSFLEDF